MTPITPKRPRVVPALAAAVIAVVTLLSLAAAPAAAEPAKPPNEGGSSKLATLRQNLQVAGAAYLEAQSVLEVSQQKQAALVTELAQLEKDQVRLREIVGLYAADAYKSGRLGVISVMLNSRSPDGFLAKANALDKMTQRDQNRLAAYTTSKQRVATAKADIDAEVKKQSALVAEMAKRKKATETALAKALGSQTVTGYVNYNSPLAKPAPRRADGSWPSESCTIDDPTTSRCISPRTLHAMNEARAAGFKHYVSCFRSGGGGDHPLGKACDFAANATGFANVSAGGADRTYGNQLAAFFVKNAGRLGITYVIWYCKIWVNGAWKSYSSTGSKCGDSPAGDHTNHVHLSMI